MSDSSSDAAKRRVAERALGFVEPGMRVGLGTGTTATVFVELLGEQVRSGLSMMGVPTSERTRTQATALGIPLSTLEDTPELDVTIDGADEFDPELRLIKGGGGALLREKIVAAASRSMIVIADASKRVARLGAFPLPVEVNRFGLAATRRLVERNAGRAGLGGSIALRAGADATPFVTDGGHLILDCRFGVIPDAERLAHLLYEVPGVVEHGLFLGYAKAVVTDDGVKAIVLGPEGPRS